MSSSTPPVRFWYTAKASAWRHDLMSLGLPNEYGHDIPDAMVRRVVPVSTIPEVKSRMEMF